MRNFPDRMTNNLRCRFAATTALVSLVMTAPASAQSGLLTAAAPKTDMQTTIEPFEDWQVICDQPSDDASTCSMAVSGTAQTSNGGVVGIRLSQLPVKNAKNALFAVETPLDLLLSKGIEMRVDSGPLMRLAFRSCHRDGCLAPFSMSPEIGRRFRKGHALAIRVFDLNAKPVEVRLSLQGFTAAGNRAGI
ncbi:MAG: invasion associated locus B family protein [Hoeflea sp.]|uniref:invasion associated locus B family protein n=1 Tax=Hoeflea sp. TaxID=1940281 RepID=UPI003EF6380D